MKQIRANAFETNSSSSHSLVLDDSSSFIPDTYFGVIIGGILTPRGEREFGWQWDIWSSAEDKLAYLYIDHEYNTQYIYDLENLLKDKLNINSIDWTYIKEGYIDHESNGNTSEITIDKAWNFLTNPNSVIRGGNDNDDGPW